MAPAGGAAQQKEEVVQGHTTYATLRPEEPRSISVIGDVRCHVEVLDVELTVPPSVGNVEANCSGDVTVFGSLLESPDPRGRDLTKTGRVLEAEGPQGRTWTTTEWTYQAQGEEWTAWTVDVEERRVDPGSGEPYRFVLGVPGDTGGQEVQLRAGSAP